MVLQLRLVAMAVVRLRLRFVADAAVAVVLRCYGYGAIAIGAVISRGVIPLDNENV